VQKCGGVLEKRLNAEMLSKLLAKYRSLGTVYFICKAVGESTNWSSISSDTAELIWLKFCTGTEVSPRHRHCVSYYGGGTGHLPTFPAMRADDSVSLVGWRSTVVDRRSLSGELTLPCARPTTDEWPLRG